jgi:glyoxylase-like metal-dependent hydrolase (beta-lactamase superfamily II)
MAALQWSYHGVEGVPAMVPALAALLEQQPDCLLPSHGEIIRNPRQAIELLEERLFRLMEARQDNPNLKNWMREPYVRVTQHLLRNRTSLANSYVLLSESGKALLIDYGYDFLTANVSGPDRAMHRPLLSSLPALKRDFGVTKIDAVIATHPHDDHVAGFNLLRSVEGAQVWAAESFAGILEHPSDYNLPCLWYDPIPVDRVLPLGQAVQWEEYQIVVYPLAGHTRYSVAIGFEVDGKRVLATGDQYKGEGGVGWNYVYQNGFEMEDYHTSALFYEQYHPDLILPGHWAPLWTDERYFRHLCERGETLAGLHRDLLPLDMIDLGAEGFAARMQPYHWMGKAGGAICYQVEVRNPLHQEAEISARLVLPPGWQPRQQAGGQPGDMEQRIRLSAGGKGCLFFQVLPPPNTLGKRFRLAVDLAVGDYHLGQQAEALVDLI